MSSIRGASRRTALKTLAAIPFAAPLARAFAAGPNAPPPKRLVLVMQNNGTQQSNFWPDANLSSPILDALFTDSAGVDNGLRNKTTLVKGMSIPFDGNGSNANQHDMGFARLFTGEKLMSKAGSPWGGGPSVDQILAKDWQQDTLALAVIASGYEPYPKPGFDHRRSFVYLGPGQLKYPALDPLTAYTKLFGATGTSNPRQRLLRRKSVLDAVTGNLTEVAARLGADDGRKLDYHLTSIRDVEQRLSATLDKTAKACAMPSRPKDFLAADPDAETASESVIPDLVDSMIDLGTVALACGLTRIVTLQLGFSGGKWGFAWEGINIEFHDFIAHLDTSDAGSSPENTDRVVRANRYYASRVARFATALDAVGEGSGTVLDSTLVVWGNELGRGDHSQKNVPVALLGLTGQGLPAGGRVIDRGPQPFNRLGCTILNKMGHPCEGFGDIPDCGMFAGI